MSGGEQVSAEIAFVLQALLLLSAIWLALETRGQKRAASNNTILLQRQLLGEVQPQFTMAINLKPDKPVRFELEIEQVHGALARQIRPFIWDHENQNWGATELTMVFCKAGSSATMDIPKRAYTSDSLADEVLKYSPEIDKAKFTELLKIDDTYSVIFLFFFDINGLPYLARRRFNYPGETAEQYGQVRTVSVPLRSTRLGILARFTTALDTLFGIDPRV
jgi:hypothetical protein